MAGMTLYKEQLPLLYPRTFAALQELVMAMAACYRNAGKKTWFGRDKGTTSLMKFNGILKRTLFAMIMDEVVSEADDSETFVVQLIEILDKFSKAFPNWIDAYAFASYYFSPDRKEVLLAQIDRLRAC